MTEKQRLLDALTKSAKEHWLAHLEASEQGGITTEVGQRMVRASEEHERVMEEFDRLESDEPAQP